MTGERWWWFHLSHELGIPVQRLMAETTPTDFFDHIEYMTRKMREEREQEFKEKKAEHYYLAQIAQEVARKFAKKPEDITLDMFLLEFEFKKPKSEEEIQQEKIRQSKAAWGAFTGLTHKIFESEGM